MSLRGTQTPALSLAYSSEDPQGSCGLLHPGGRGDTGTQDLGARTAPQKEAEGNCCKSQSGAAGVPRRAGSSRPPRRQGKASLLAEQKSSGPPSLLLDTTARPPGQERRWILKGPSLVEEVTKGGASLKAVLAGSPPDNTVDLSGIPLTPRDLERVTGYLQRCGEQVDSVELGFTGLTDDMALQLLPALSTLPRLTTLALNGNRLTRALLRDLTDALKDPSKFPSVTWIDLGNNVDIFSLPQPFLLSLRKRSPKQGHLPTILELGEGPGSGDEARDETVGQEDPGGDQEARETTGASQT
uniref:Leucine-rich repeat-containing protein 75A isoform X2 n=1 Tax=Tursiops truncatus TaxID=9739 RepID=A0A6J3QL39_TURTR|nr:leucine-rich repeat-containing protein 75A isoform X2 [Tursiops truncatus]